MNDFEIKFSATLSDYVTSVVWSKQGQTAAATSAAGEVALWQGEELVTLHTGNGDSVDCAAFSRDGQFLAAGGQDGKVRIWRDTELITTLDNPRTWVDKLAWSPTKNHLAFSLGRYAQVWDADSGSVVATLNFEDSAPLGIDWRNDGKYIAIGGNRGAKIWNTQDWDDDPFIFEMPTVSVAIAWSPDGKFLASGNMDRTISVVETGSLTSGMMEPWVMRGFPGKIRHLAWSDISTPIGAPLLACSSVEGVIVWEKLEDDSQGWEARVLTNHVGIINAIAFAPNSFLLASAAADGWLCLWKEAQQVSQILTGAEGGFSTLAWNPDGKLLAGGGDNGSVLIWAKTSRGKGFGKN